MKITPDPIMAEALLLSESRDYKAAVESYLEARKVNPRDPTVLTGLGWALLNQSRYRESLAVYLEFCGYYPDDFHAHEGAGLSYAFLRQYDAAVQEIQKAIDLAPGRVEPYVFLICVYRSMGRLDAARDVLERVEQFAPDNFYVHLEAGTVATTARDYPTALQRFHQAQTVQPDSPDVAYRLGRVYFDIADYRSARDAFAKALAATPQWPDALYGFARAEIKLKDYRKATRALEGVIEALPSFRPAYIALGKLQFRTGKWAACWNTARRWGDYAAQE